MHEGGRMTPDTLKEAKALVISSNLTDALGDERVWALLGRHSSTAPIINQLDKTGGATPRVDLREDLFLAVFGRRNLWVGATWSNVAKYRFANLGEVANRAFTLSECALETLTLEISPDGELLGDSAFFSETLVCLDNPYGAFECALVEGQLARLVSSSCAGIEKTLSDFCSIVKLRHCYWMPHVRMIPVPGGIRAIPSIRVHFLVPPDGSVDALTSDVVVAVQGWLDLLPSGSGYFSVSPLKAEVHHYGRSVGSFVFRPDCFVGPGTDYDLAWQRLDQEDEVTPELLRDFNSRHLAALWLRRQYLLTALATEGCFRFPKTL